MTDTFITANGVKPTGTYEAIIGQKIVFEIKSTEGTVSNVRWNLSGAEGCGNFEMSKKSSTRILPLQGTGPVSIWCACCPGKALVSAKVNFEGRSVSIQLKVRIHAPKVWEFSSETDAIHTGLIPSEMRAGGAYYLTFGGLKSTMKPGIRWKAKIIGTKYGGGSYAFVQLMQIDRKRYYKGALLQEWGGTSNGEWVLDEDVFYGTSVRVRGDGGGYREKCEDFIRETLPDKSICIYGEDSPATPLFQVMPEDARFRFDELKIDERFKTYLMFKPDVPDNSIWVSIARLDWFWKVHAKFDDGGWNIVQSSFKESPNGKLGIYLTPKWAKNRDDILR